MFSVGMEDMNNTVDSFLAELDYSPEYLEILEEVLTRKFRRRQKEIVKESQGMDKSVSLLKEKKAQTLESIIQASSSSVIKLLEEKIEDIEAEITNKESPRYIVDLKEDDIKELIMYAKKIVEHPQKALLDKDNPIRQKKLFELVCNGIPTYKELNSGTAQLTFVFNSFKGKSTEKISANSCWGDYRESNPNCRYHKPE